MSSAVWRAAYPLSESESTHGVEAAFDHCATALYRYFVVRVGPDAGLADDLMQQLWIQAQRVTGTPTDEIEFRLRAIARNLIRTHWRRQGRRPAHVSLPRPELAAELADRLVSDELPDTVLVQREVRDQLLLALTELPAAQQTLIEAHYFEGRSHAEIAALLGVGERTVEGRLYRARRTLREKLRHLEAF